MKRPLLYSLLATFAVLVALATHFLARRNETDRIKNDSLTEVPNNGGWTGLDSWFSPMPYDLVACEKVLSWNDLDRNLITSVADRHLKSAIGKLETRSAVALEFDEADSLTETTVIRASGLKPYLLRAVVLDEPRWGSLRLKYKSTDVWVDYGTLGRSPLPMKRHPIIALLPREPKEVYVDVTMAE